MAFRIRDATRVRAVAKTTKTRPCGCDDAACDCAVCRTLVCTERPRYFAGQLLTETELNSEQAYLLAKQRLHNRYLHGVGVVCGLEVVCHECDGWVRVQPGYALDPCGNDIVVCEAQDFDVLDAIRRCRQVDRRRGECEPYRSSVSRRCEDETEHWCLTIRYAEKEARPATPLLNGRSKAGCGPSSSSSNGCEATRIVEGYQLELLCQPDHCVGDFRQLLRQPDLTSPLLRCVTSFQAFLNEQLQQEKILQSDIALVVQTAYSTQLPDLSFDTAQQLNAVCGRFWCFVYNLYSRNPLDAPIGNCAIFQTLDALACPPLPPAGAEGNLQDYYRALQARFRRLFDLMYAYLIDCLCHHLLPSCSAEPCDDRLILACIEVRDGRIVRIGNFCCRQIAGSFPAVSQWLSLIPGLPWLVDLVKAFCCDPQFSDFIADQVRTRDPNSATLTRLSADAFSAPRAYASSLAQRVGEEMRRGLDLSRWGRSPNEDGTATPVSPNAQPAVQPGAQSGAQAGAGEAALRAELDDLRRQVAELQASMARRPRKSK